MKLLGFLVLAVSAVVSNAIISGTTSENVPYHANILFLNAANLGGNGGGSIISQRHILTAGTRVSGFISWTVTIGSNNRELGNVIPVTIGISHPGFVNSPRANDIGILVLNTNLVFSPFIQPIALPSMDTTLPWENEQGLIVGFGGTPAINTPTLQAAFKRVVSPAMCLARWPTAALAQQFCSEDSRLRSDVCNGDLGGGFTVLTRGHEVLVGIASVAHCSTASVSPSLYTRVTAYRTWIRNETNI
ncbi:unnamed protein product [Diamesa hyperborea]